MEKAERTKNRRKEDIKEMNEKLGNLKTAEEALKEAKATKKLAEAADEETKTEAATPA